MSSNVVVGNVSIEKTSEAGASFNASMICKDCQHTWSWSNNANNQTYNALFCGSLLFTGQLPSKIDE